MSHALRAEIGAALEAIKRRSSARLLLEEDLRACPPQGEAKVRVLAIGKAAQFMSQATLRVLGERVQAVLCIGSSEMDEGSDGRVQTLVGDHPIPGQGSFRAGQTVLEWSRRARSEGASVMVLLSGGASALCEWPAAGVSEEALAQLHRDCVSSGESIETINKRRGQHSALKAGGLAELLGASLIDVRVLVDVPSGDPSVVGSGPCASASYRGSVRVIGAPSDLVELAAAQFDEVTTLPARSWSLSDLTERMRVHAAQGKGAWITAGEVQVALPAEVLGRREGGRAQHLALGVACLLHDQGPWAVLAWASDGCDGKGGGGALITSEDSEKLVEAAAQGALNTWNSGSYLASIGCRLNSFASETNLTDLYMVLRL